MASLCDGCNGTGVRAPATPSCTINDIVGWVIVERCDECETFPDDEAAAKSLFHEVRWVKCTDHGNHVIAR